MRISDWSSDVCSSDLLGSERSIDMSYTGSADLYLGDVSSQVAEYLYRPRPCVFLNAQGVDWQEDPNYRFWSLGPVIRSEERRVGKECVSRVDLGGRRIIKKKIKKRSMQLITTRHQKRQNNRKA